MISVKCPACGRLIELDEDIKRNDTVYCEYCDVQLIVFDLDPLHVEELSFEDYEQEINPRKKRSRDE